MKQTYDYQILEFNREKPENIYTINILRKELQCKINEIMKNFIRKFEFLAEKQMVILEWKAMQYIKTPMDAFGIRPNKIQKYWTERGNQ